MVGAVDLAVTVEAVLTQQVLVTTAAGETSACVGQVGITRAAVRIMAVTAGGFAFGNRMAGGQEQVGSNPSVAAPASLLGFGGSESRILLLVAALAAVAGHSLALVFTARPVQGGAAPVAAETAAAALLCRRAKADFGHHS